MVHLWVMAQAKEEWWCKITDFAPQTLQTYRAEIPVFLILSYTHQFCSVMIKLFSYSIFFLIRQLFLHGEVTGSPMKRTQHHSHYRQWISYYDSAVAKNHCFFYLIVYHSNKVEIFIYLSLRWGHFDKYLCIYQNKICMPCPVQILSLTEQLLILHL